MDASTRRSAPGLLWFPPARRFMWDQVAYYNPTNFTFNGFFKINCSARYFELFSITVPINAVGVNIS